MLSNMVVYRYNERCILAELLVCLQPGSYSNKMCIILNVNIYL